MHKSNFLEYCNATVSFCKLDEGKWEYNLVTPKGKISSTFYTKETPTAEGLLTGFQRHLAVDDAYLLEGLRKVFTEEQLKRLGEF